MNTNRGIKWAILLTKNLNNEVVDGLGTGAWKRTDGRQTIDNVIAYAKSALKSENNFQNIYIGFRLVVGTISSNREVYRYIDENLEKEYDEKRKPKVSPSPADTYIGGFENVHFNVHQLDLLERKIRTLRKDGYLVLRKEEDIW